MNKYYIYKQEVEGVYKVSLSDFGNYIAEFESLESNTSSVLQEADKCIATSANEVENIQVTFIFDIQQ